MSKRTILLSTVVVVLLVAVGGLLASNMAFKLNRILQAALGGVSVDGTNAVGFPFNKQLGLSNATQLVGDICIGVSPCGFAPGPVLNVQRFNPSNNTSTLYSGGRTSNFPLEETVGYRIRVATTVPYLMAGSHNPSKLADLIAATPGVSVDGTNDYSYPWHSSAANATQLITEIGGFAPGPVLNVQRFNPSNNTATLYSGGRTSNFPLLPGSSYRVRVSATTQYRPSHF